MWKSCSLFLLLLALLLPPCFSEDLFVITGPEMQRLEKILTELEDTNVLLATSLAESREELTLLKSDLEMQRDELGKAETALQRLEASLKASAAEARRERIKTGVKWGLLGFLFGAVGVPATRHALFR